MQAQYNVGAYLVAQNISWCAEVFLYFVIVDSTLVLRNNRKSYEATFVTVLVVVGIIGSALNVFPERTVVALRAQVHGGLHLGIGTGYEQYRRQADRCSQLCARAFSLLTFC